MKRNILIGLAVLVVAAGIYTIYIHAKLPSLTALRNYRPPLSTEIYSQDGIKLAEFFEERRFFVPITEIPKKVIDAVLSAEDEDFFEHQGLSFRGIFRAAFKNLASGSVKQGGSTITQQVAKALLLSPERNFSRKIKEAMLATKIEKAIPKERILEIYLNEIYFGSGAYGIKSAADAYFGKTLAQLNVIEAAALAGSIKAPSRDNPRSNPEKSRRRQAYVLRRMFENGHITEQEYKSALVHRISVLAENPVQKVIAPYFIETIRQQLVLKYGSEQVLRGGLRVITTLKFKDQMAAEQAMQKGLEAIDQHQGFRGAVGHLAQPFEAEQLKPFRALSPWTEGTQGSALVLRINDSKKLVTVVAMGHEGTIAFSSMRWARKPDPNVYWQNALIKVPSEALKVGDVVTVRMLKNISQFELVQTPLVQGAFVALDVRTGRILAMVGGSDFEKSKFNRAIQAKRQPGSAFKPFIYAAALEKGFTPATLLMDEPLEYPVGPGSKNEVWKPQNYEHKFKGKVLLRTCLIESRNIPTIKLLESLGTRQFLSFAKGFGFESILSPNLSLALGTSEVTPYELARAYGVFPNQGKLLPKANSVLRVTDTRGSLLEDHLLEPQAVTDQAISPQGAFIMTHLLAEAAKYGTGRLAYIPGLHMGGKTGTTNDNRDAWFAGFTPHKVATVWIGMDQPTESLGIKEDGGKIAGPIWHDYMVNSLSESEKKLTFEQPEGLLAVAFNSRTGKVSADPERNNVTEWFSEKYLPGLEDGYDDDGEVFTLRDLPLYDEGHAQQISATSKLKPDMIKTDPHKPEKHLEQLHPVIDKIHQDYFMNP